MKDSALIKLLQTFSNKEIKELRDFLDSPYFNKRKGAVKLFDIIKKFHPDFDSDKISKENVIKKLFPGKKYNDSTFRVLVHYLMGLAERYLAYSRFGKNNLEFSLQLDTELYDRKQYKLLEKSMSRSFKFLDEMNLEAEEYFSYKFRLANEKTYYLFASNYALFDKVVKETDWESVFKDLTNYYVLKSMLMYLNTLNIGTIYNKDFKSQTFKNVFYKITIEEFEDIPVIKMYYYIIKMITEISDESNFYKVKELLRKNKIQLNKFDTIGAYVNLEGYCQRRISEGNSKFEKELFEIFKEELAEKTTYLTSDGYMSPIFYRNVVTSGLGLKEFSFVKSFIQKYQTELNKRFRDNYFYYCSALFEFYTDNYQYALELNSKIKYDELYMKLNSKLLQLQLFYEMDIEDSLVSALESFRHFLTNNELIPEARRITYTNFHKYLSKLLTIIVKKNKTELEMLKKKLSAENKVSNKGWLINKINLEL